MDHQMLKSNWKVWNANIETWEEWPCNICIPITRNIKFVHTKNVGQSKLDVFLENALRDLSCINRRLLKGREFHVDCHGKKEN
jgi:hypothetical protein